MTGQRRRPRPSRVNWWVTCWVAAGLALLGTLAQAAPAVPGADLVQVEVPRNPALSALRINATRWHAQCPLRGEDRQLRTLVTLKGWQTAMTQPDARALGQRVDWSRERVLVFALAQQPAHGTRLTSPQTLLVKSGVLWWPVTVLNGTGVNSTSAAVGTERPCLIASVARHGWQRVRVIERQRDN